MNSERRVNLTLPRWMMMACCVVPIALAILFISGSRIPGGSGLWLMLLICPLVHFIMMRSGGGHDYGSKKDKKDGESCCTETGAGETGGAR